MGSARSVEGLGGDEPDLLSRDWRLAPNHPQAVAHAARRVMRDDPLAAEAGDRCVHRVFCFLASEVAALSEIEEPHHEPEPAPFVA
jgi:hypothetical protein